MDNKTPTRATKAKRLMESWRKITKLPKDHVHVDVWMRWGASPMTMGMADSFRQVDVFRQDGKWVHYYKGEVAELKSDYITHWMPIPKEPK